jgi:hypothetical protein
MTFAPKKRVGRGIVRYAWKCTPCPRGCGALWYHWVYKYPRQSDCCCKVWWKRNRSKGWYCPPGNKATATFRVVPSGDSWAPHPTRPEWREKESKDGAGRVYPCCGGEEE